MSVFVASLVLLAGHRLSPAPSAPYFVPNNGNGNNYASISADGTKIAYLTNATGGTGGAIYVFDRTTSSNTLVSGGLYCCTRPRISRDGTAVAFHGVPSSTTMVMYPFMNSTTGSALTQILPTNGTTHALPIIPPAVYPSASSTSRSSWSTQIWSTSTPPYGKTPPGISNLVGSTYTTYYPDPVDMPYGTYWYGEYVDPMAKSVPITFDTTPEFIDVTVMSLGGTPSAPNFMNYAYGIPAGGIQCDCDSLGVYGVVNFDGAIIDGLSQGAPGHPKYISGLQCTDRYAGAWLTLATLITPDYAGSGNCANPTIDGAGVNIAFDSGSGISGITPPNTYRNIYVAKVATTSIIVPYSDTPSTKSGNCQYPAISSDGLSVGFVASTATLNYKYAYTFGKIGPYGPNACAIWNMSWSSANQPVIESIQYQVSGPPYIPKTVQLCSISNAGLSYTATAFDSTSTTIPNLSGSLPGPLSGWNVYYTKYN